MSRFTPGRAAWLLWLTLSAAACADDAEEPSRVDDDAGQTPPDGQVGAPDSGLDAGQPAPLDAATDGAVPSALVACLDRPEAITKAPTASLPCELLPPGFGK